MKENYAKKSLEGLWVGDCVGNLGQLYFVHDILKALEQGLAKFGGQLNQFHQQFQHSDDTEEAIVLYNHLFTNNGVIDQDKLAKEFATRYMERDPDGEIYGYGLNTRKVLRDIYEGVPWKDANKIIKKSEGMPSHVDSLVGSLADGESFKEAFAKVNACFEREYKEKHYQKGKEGSCGNGSAMRVAPLGGFLIENSTEEIVAMAALQAQVTHCHPEGIAGAIATAVLSSFTTECVYNLTNYYPCNHGLTLEGIKLDGKILYELLLDYVPDSEVKNGINRAMNLPFNTPLSEVIAVLGNGSHVTCQDTVPLCCWLAIKALNQYSVEEMYEKSIIETSMAFGDVDTNCAIVGGIIGVVSPPPVKWANFCQPMEGLVC